MAQKIHSGDDDLSFNYDINVTPFIDVILVLLIIFMVAAPLATVDVPVDLPQSHAAPSPRPDQPVFVSIKADGAFLVGDKPVAKADLGAALRRECGENAEQRIYLRGDKNLPYGELMAAIDTIRDAGYPKIGLMGLDVRGAAL